jgi:hypothetical protein
MTTTCSKCGGTMEKGYTTAEGLMVGETVTRHRSQLLFLVSDAATPLDPIEAFKQGFSGNHPRRMFRMEGFRCSKCGLIELYGTHGEVR